MIPQFVCVHVSRVYVTVCVRKCVCKNVCVCDCVCKYVSLRVCARTRASACSMYVCMCLLSIYMNVCTD